LKNLHLEQKHIRHLEKIQQYFNRFVPISKEEFDQLLPYCEVREIDKKQQLVKLGQVDNYFNIVLKGLVRKYIIVGKKEVTMQLAVEGQMIHSEISFNTQQPSEMIVETIEPSIVFSISYEKLEKVYARFPKIERLGRLVITDMFIKKDYRDFSQLKKTTRERFLDYMNRHPDMLQRVPQKYIASYLNIKPETFSRLKHLVKNQRQRV
jgi:CRP-like cAMP-binding protein